MTISRLFITGAAIAVWALLLPAPATAQETLVLTAGLGEPLTNSQQTGFLDLLIGRAFRRIGVKVEVSHLPSERALINANAGIDDGALIRVGGMEKTHPNLRQVPEKAMDFDFVAFAKNIRFAPSGWGSLKPYDVGILNGWKILERNIKGTQSLVKVEAPSQLFNLLQNDRTDVIIYERWQGMHLIKNQGLKNIRLLEPPLVVREQYTYLHKKHEYLVPRVAASLREMKNDGTYRDIYNKTLNRSFKK